MYVLHGPKLIHAKARTGRKSSASRLEKAALYFENAKRYARGRRSYEASIFYAKAQKILLSILRRNEVKEGMEVDKEASEITEIKDEYIMYLMESAWLSMNM